MGTFMENVVVFSKTLLQNLYDGTFAGDSQTLLHFLADQILAVRQLQSLYCFNLMVIWIIYNVRHVCTLFFFFILDCGKWPDSQREDSVGSVLVHQQSPALFLISTTAFPR